jgi:hypothetical protein
LTALAVLAAAGCGRGPEWAEVEGVVTLDGKPLPNVEVVFLPDPELGSAGPRAAALTDAEGRYHLRGDAGQEGAVVGWHRVLIVDNAARPKAPGRPAVKPGDADDNAPAGGVALPKQRPRPSQQKMMGRVPARYTSATETPLKRVEVKPGPQRHDFDVPGRADKPA